MQQAITTREQPFNSQIIIGVCHLQNSYLINFRIIILLCMLFEYPDSMFEKGLDADVGVLSKQIPG